MTSFQMSILINVMTSVASCPGSGIGITMAPARQPYRQLQARPMFESGHSRPSRPAPVPTIVRYAPSAN